MKKILVPIDFSETSLNAAAYSVELARRLQAELLLFHCFQLSEFYQDSIYVMEKAQASEEEYNQRLEKLKNSILKDHPDLKVRDFCTFGVPVNEINFQAEEEGVDLIVIGAHGAGYLKEKFIGSTASSLIHSAVVPVLVIDQHIKFEPLKNIVLATDFIETENQRVLKPLKKLTDLFDAHLSVLNVYKEDNLVPTIDEINAGFELDKSLKQVNHTFFYINEPEIIEGINVFIKKQKMDMVVMIARKHSLIRRIFRQPHTKTMAFHSHVPFLVLHE